MKISVEPNEQVQISFKGKINMSQSVTLSKTDAKKLSELLTSDTQQEFETE